MRCRRTRIFPRRHIGHFASGLRAQRCALVAYGMLTWHAHPANSLQRMLPDCPYGYPRIDVSGAEAARAGRRLFGQSVRQERTHQARAMQAKRSMSALARISAAAWSPTPESPKPRPIKGATSVTGDLLTLIIDRKSTQQGLSDAQSRPCLAPEDHCGNEQYPSLSIALVRMGVRTGAMAKAPETALPQSQGPKRVPRAGLEPASSVLNRIMWLFLVLSSRISLVAIGTDVDGHPPRRRDGWRLTPVVTSCPSGFTENRAPIGARFSLDALLLYCRTNRHSDGVADHFARVDFGVGGMN